jgi:adenine-specific DNA-methyltransferase
LRESYRKRFSSFKQRADLYVAFIERSLDLLEPNGQLAFLCPGNWTRNVYGGAVRKAFTSQLREATRMLHELNQSPERK